MYYNYAPSVPRDYTGQPYYRGQEPLHVPGYVGGGGYLGNASVEYWRQSPPTPPRAASPSPPHFAFPQPRRDYEPPQHRQQEAPTREQLQFGSYGPPQGAIWRGSSPAVAQDPLPQSRAPTALAKGNGTLVCDRCDGPHESERCPYFAKSRESHPDAWAHYSGQPGGPSAAVRECVAPAFLRSGSVSVVRMPADGACLFHSLAHGLGTLGHEESGLNVRQHIAQVIASTPDCEIAGTPLREWVEMDSQMSSSAYASMVARGGIWGGAIEMAVFTHIYGVDVGVYEEDGYNGGFRLISGFAAPDGKRDGHKRCVCLKYSGRSHYDALAVSAAGGRRHRPQEYAEEEEEQSLCSGIM